MKTKKENAALIIAIIALCLSVLAICSADRTSIPEKVQESGDVQYVMYLGTNDKDTNEPVCSPEEAKEKAADILVDHFGGYTIQDANGGWKDGDTLYKEYTLVIYLSDTTSEDVHAAADDLIEAFNQSSVLIQENKTVTEFYSGS